MVKLVIITIFLFSFSSIYCECKYTDIELITLVEQTISNSLLRVKRMGKLGTEEIEGLISGILCYSAKLTGFNKVKNILELKQFQDDILIICGKQISDVNLSGTGKTISDYRITGSEEFSLIMIFDLKRKIPVSGSYFITRKGSSSTIEYPFDIIEY